MVYAATIIGHKRPGTHPPPDEPRPHPANPVDRFQITAIVTDLRFRCKWASGVVAIRFFRKTQRKGFVSHFFTNWTPSSSRD